MYLFRVLLIANLDRFPPRKQIVHDRRILVPTGKHYTIIATSATTMFRMCANSDEIKSMRIASLPSRVRLGHYMFFADFEGAAGETACPGRPRRPPRRVETLRVLGSYSAAS